MNEGYVDDEALIREWENDADFSNFLDDSDLHSYNGNFESGQGNLVSSEKTDFNGQIDNDIDYAIAMSLQMDFYDEVKENTNANSEKYKASKPLSIVDEQWELIDPHPDIHSLFVQYDEKYFYGKLKSVEVRWSKRMTLCAGICSYQGRGGLCSIGLSEPLLKLRPRRDLIETLLHEMIHAYLFVTQNNKDREGHGPEFLSHMHRINKESGTKITVYHSFHDEVNLYKQHWWKCDGPCRNRSPYFGLVKRAMNRVPGPNDNWWEAHQHSCGGKFVKIKEPNNFSEKKIPKRKLHSESNNKSFDIRKFIKVNNSDPSNKRSSQPSILDIDSSTSYIQNTSPQKTDTSTAINTAGMTKKKNFIPFLGTGHKLDSSSGSSQASSNFSSLNSKNSSFEFKRDLLFSKFSNALDKGALPSSSTGKVVTKRDIDSSSPGKALTKRDLHSSSPRKTLAKKDLLISSTGNVVTKRDIDSSSRGKALTKEDLHSSSPRKTLAKKDLHISSTEKVVIKRGIDSSSTGKILIEKDLHSSSLEKGPARKDLLFGLPGKTNASQTQYLQKGLDFFVSASSNKTNGSKSAVETDSLPRNITDCLQESCVSGVNFSSSVSTELYCPVCSCLVKEEINSHLDKCLKNSTE